MGTLTKLQKAILSGDKDLLKVTDLPGIGPRIGRYMNDLGYYRVGDLRGADAAEMYTRHNILRGFEDDPCFLYVFRMAIYFAENDVHDPELLRWWNWRREGEGGPQKKKRR
ncbi:helix-hairpin-helix domain-containing protein [Dysosmobacter sp.]|uniref:helix-hairpin-helix domain-containing protein n=1 Tax=Dysosmobacter sp. TaxID=2591382 RepID=UPI002A97665D|nr:helix-hairpin-helix domain-containing protein [Dysosmobacter sp.]MDY5612209.1 helix-hairpin-helix domain-containing protein [Dysosmobacter sp.]